jgi:hypothetical protein
MYRDGITLNTKLKHFNMKGPGYTTGP